MHTSRYNGVVNLIGSGKNIARALCIKSKFYYFTYLPSIFFLTEHTPEYVVPVSSSSQQAKVSPPAHTAGSRKREVRQC